MTRQFRTETAKLHEITSYHMQWLKYCFLVPTSFPGTFPWLGNEVVLVRFVLKKNRLLILVLQGWALTHHILRAKIDFHRYNFISYALTLALITSKRILRGARMAGPGPVPYGWVKSHVGSCLAPRLFLQVLWFSPLHKHQHLQIPVWLGQRTCMETG